MFRVYSGPVGAAMGPMDKSKFLHKQFDSLDEALNWAHHIRDTGRTALLIEGDDGTRIDKRQLAKALHHRGSEHVRPSHREAIRFRLSAVPRWCGGQSVLSTSAPVTQSDRFSSERSSWHLPHIVTRSSSAPARG